MGSSLRSNCSRRRAGSSISDEGLSKAGDAKCHQVARKAKGMKACGILDLNRVWSHRDSTSLGIKIAMLGLSGDKYAKDCPGIV